MRRPVLRGLPSCSTLPARRALPGLLPTLLALAALSLILSLAAPAAAAPVSASWLADPEPGDPASVPYIDVGYNLTNAKVFCPRPGAQPLVDASDRAMLDALYWSYRLTDLTDCLRYNQSEETTTACVVTRNVVPFREFRPVYGLQTSTYDVAAYLGVVAEDNTGTPLHRPMIVLGVRGTSNFEEILLDVQGWQANCSAVGIRHPDCMVHEGFSKGFNALHGPVAEILEGMVERYPTAAIRIAGHSLGGALTTLFAPHVAANYSANHTVTLFTSGSPRVFSPGYAKAFRELVPRAYRLVQFLDPVPHVPPNASELLGSYAHVGEPYFTFSSSIGSCGRTYLATARCTRVGDTGEDSDCQNTLWNFKASFKTGIEAFLTGAAFLSSWPWHPKYFVEHVPVNPFPGKW
ncbi:Alpha/Beta hydrolase protein [Hyaloraphidium curvatum]|nr:Alpha/Beta hydrolase protein [Hyaloraphidium curvatum]